MKKGKIPKTDARQIARITIIIPAHNEEKDIGQVLDAIPKTKLNALGFDPEVLVIDNNSTDKTADIAARKGARVIFESKRGKGNALQAGFRNIAADSVYVVMLDGDNSHRPSEIPLLLEPLKSRFADVVIGSRLESSVKNGSMSMPHGLANRFFTFLVQHMYRTNVTDVCCGFIGWEKGALEKLSRELVSEGFTIETEMAIKAAKMEFRMHSVPITCIPRHQGESKVSPLRDGLRIIATIVRNLRWKSKGDREQRYF